ncbi:MAG: hypothetical protein OEL53_12330 [Rhodospirillales bacterium]|nr:hypothetical protein [Rhodospirillales bacterium]
MSAVASAMPMAAITEVSDDTVKVVRETLKGPVIQTMRRLVPDLAQISAETAYDHALANLGILEKCFKAFREQRGRFRHILVNKSGQVVTNDTGVLSCGHNLEVVIAMVVRTAAKRYFRHHVGLHKTPKFASAQPGLLGKMKKALVSSTTEKSMAEELYECIKGYLLFEWQVPLVPTYAKLSPDQITNMGRQILNFTDVSALAKAAGLPVPASAVLAAASAQPARPVSYNAERNASKSAGMRPRPASPMPEIRPLPANESVKIVPLERPAPPPQPISMQPIALRSTPIAASSALAGSAPARTGAAPAPGGKKLSGASFESVLALPHVQAAIDPNLHGLASIRVIDLVGARAWAALILTLGLRRKDQLAVLILNSFGALGLQEFRRVLGNEANPEILDQLLAGVSEADISPSSSPSDIIGFVVKTFSPARTASLS